jgi:hypothetical protein
LVCEVHYIIFTVKHRQSMSSLLTPQRRERAKKKSRNAAQSVSPSFRSSNGNINMNVGKYQAMTDNDDSPPRNIPPRTVTPTKGGGGSSSSVTSWEDYDEGIFSSSSTRTVPGRYRSKASSISSSGSVSSQQSSTIKNHNSNSIIMVTATPTRPHNTVTNKESSASLHVPVIVQHHPFLRNQTTSSSFDYNINNSNNNRIVLVDDEKMIDEDMPMDERMDRRKDKPHDNSIDFSVRSRRSVGSADADSTTYLSVTPTKEVSDIVSNMSFELCQGKESKGIGRMIDALNNGSNSRPGQLNREECILWDAIQTAMVNDRNENLAKRRSLERSLQEATTKLKQITARETELELELTKSKCECGDLEHKYTMALAENRVLVGHKKKGDGVDDDEVDGVDKVQQQLESLERKLQEKDALLKQHQDDHNAEVRAIQRVLADVTTDKVKLQELLAEMEKTGPSGQQTVTTEKSEFPQRNTVAEAAVPAGGVDAKIQALEEEKSNAVRELEKKTKQLQTLERELKVTKTQIHGVVEEKKKLSSEVATAKSETEHLKSKIGELESEVSTQKQLCEELQGQVELLTKARDDAVREAAEVGKEAKAAMVEQISRVLDPPKPELDHPKPESSSSHDEDAEEIPQDECVDTKSIGSKDEIEILKKNLSETNSSLENAKKIIASLESANGSLALDLRAKLKAKEEELSMVQKESEERKRRLDSLATELRDLQRKQGDIEEADRRTKAQLMRQKALVGHLQASLSDLQAAVVVHESSVSAESGALDKSSIEEISEILADTLHAVKVTLEMAEEFIEDADDVSAVNTDAELSSEVGRHVDAIIRNDREAAAKELRFQLDQKRIAVRRLEEALKKQNEEMKKMRSQYEGRGRGQGETEDQLRAEIERLRQQQQTNMEVLAKKERELSVLRSSLKVDDNDAGYISDDASDDEEGGEASVTPPPELSSYGPAEAEALATILSQTSGGIDSPGKSRDLETLKNELLKSLKERETASRELQAERESLANAKLIISSLEKANKGMMEDLRSRLQDSNTAIASLLDKSMDHEKSAEMLKQEVEKLKQEKLEEKKRYEDEVLRLKQKLPSEEETIDGQQLPSEEKKEEVLTP